MVFAAPDPSRLDIILASWFFAIQIYCDFSGYTDIARGVAKMLGFGLMRNFAQPYFATNPQEFWRRWHISLSTWLRDYLYVSLGGNRGGTWRTYRNLMLTMLLGGLWHGAAWNFVLWGFYQGMLLVVYRAFTGGATKARSSVLLHLVKIALFFQVVCYGWLLFRARSFEQITDFSHRLIFGGGTSLLPEPPLAALLGIAVIFVWDLLVEVKDDVRFYARWPVAIRAMLWAGLAYCLAFGATTTTSAFIYFQF